MWRARRTCSTAGFVTYSNAAKTEMLGVRRSNACGRMGACREEVAREMAEGALARSAATLAVAITGIAGPGGSEFKPEGRVCFGLARRGGRRGSKRWSSAPSGAAQVRRATVDHALELLMGRWR